MESNKDTFSKNSRETTGPKLGFIKFENPVRFFTVDNIACRAYEIEIDTN
jgi:hypothetical protein